MQYAAKGLLAGNVNVKAIRIVVTVYRLHVSELNDQFIEAVQAFFKDKEVEITVTEVDETEYLLRSEENRTRLMQAISKVENWKNLVEFQENMLQ